MHLPSTEIYIRFVLLYHVPPVGIMTILIIIKSENRSATIVLEGLLNQISGTRPVYIPAFSFLPYHGVHLLSVK